MKSLRQVLPTLNNSELTLLREMQYGRSEEAKALRLVDLISDGSTRTIAMLQKEIAERSKSKFYLLVNRLENDMFNMMITTNDTSPIRNYIKLFRSCAIAYALFDRGEYQLAEEKMDEISQTAEERYLYNFSLENFVFRSVNPLTRSENYEQEIERLSQAQRKALLSRAYKVQSIRHHKQVGLVPFSELYKESLELFQKMKSLGPDGIRVNYYQVCVNHLALFEQQPQAALLYANEWEEFSQPLISVDKFSISKLYQILASFFTKDYDQSLAIFDKMDRMSALPQNRYYMLKHIFLIYMERENVKAMEDLIVEMQTIANMKGHEKLKGWVELFKSIKQFVSRQFSDCIRSLKTNLDLYNDKTHGVLAIGLMELMVHLETGNIELIPIILRRLKSHITRYKLNHLMRFKAILEIITEYVKPDFKRNDARIEERLALLSSDVGEYAHCLVYDSCELLRFDTWFGKFCERDA